MNRFGLSFDAENNITMWDNLMDAPMTSGGVPMLFPAHEWMQADRIRHLMNQRVDRPELTNANGSLVSA